MVNHIRYKSIVFLLGMALLFSCQSDLQTIDELTRIDEGPMESVFNVEMVYSDEGQTRMILKAAQMDRYEGAEPYLEMPRGLQVQFYDTLGNETSSMSAKYAISYDDPEVVEARNDVVVINEAGERLNTEQLTWNQKEETIYSDKFVKITTEDEVLYGEGLESDERFDRWKITSPRGTFQAETRPRGEGEEERTPAAEPVDEPLPDEEQPQEVTPEEAPDPDEERSPAAEPVDEPLPDEERSPAGNMEERPDPNGENEDTTEETQSTDPVQ